MSKIKSFIGCLLSIALLISTMSIFTVRNVQAASSLTSDFTHLNATQLIYEMGTGWNLGNQLEATINGTPSETAWGNPTITKALVQKVKAAGFNTIRIPVSYLSKIGSAPNYTIEAAWLSRVKEVVDYAYSQGMYVIVNMHGDGYHSITGGWLLCDSNNQTTIKEKYQKVWQQIATTFNNYDEHLIFESMNEVFDGTYGVPNATYYANLNAYNQIFVDTIRQTGGNNSARWLLVPGWNTNIDYTAGNYGFVIPTDTYRSSTIPSNEKRIMISAHYYSPWDFCGETTGQITQWGATATDSSRVSTWGQEEYMDSQLKLMYDKFSSKGYPVVIGEYGSIDKTSADSSNNKYREAFAKAVGAYSKKYSCVPVYWDNGYNGEYGFALFNRSNNTITQQGIINAIMEGMNVNIPSNSSISPLETTFDISETGQTDIKITMELNGNTLYAIKNGANVLTAGTDYTVSGSNVTILKSYLGKQQVGLTTLIFDFNAGKDAELSVNIIDSSKVSGTVKIQAYNTSTSSSVNTLNPKLKLVNTGSSSVDLSKLKIRYYYTIDQEKAQSFTCDWSSVGASNVIGTFVKMPVSKTGADYYLEISFASGAGSLLAGQGIDIQVRINRTDWSNYTQSGDYSFNTVATTFVDWTKITVFQSGNLMWGVEP